ncbi:unnamed protein product, partial [Mesorhabditis belari]|uniref:G-protein coupled receptors family 1 profile domain-containing protein n=1 Tax=Mesorhabditis belari TaxID=2138241 RepID=A0AAF3FNR6_9BILA
MLAAVSAVLGVVNLVVVCGNIFVLYVLTSQKSLHSPTNFLVLSLTISDLLLGVVILPFAIMQEHRKEWIFGETWCTLWLALDVWLSTASIYNLLAISFDRYMAVRQPIKYPIISSTRVIRLMILAVWVVSFCLAFLLWILQTRLATSTNLSIDLSSNLSNIPKHCIPMTLPDEYILFSASFSFVVPAFVMVVLNVSIFTTVLKTGRSRCVSVKSGAEMRIHRGNTNAKFHNLQSLTRTRSTGDDDARKMTKCSVIVSKGQSSNQTAQTTPSGSETNLTLNLENVPLKINDTGKCDSPFSNDFPPQISPLPTIRNFLSQVMVVSMMPNRKRKTELLDQISTSNRGSRARFSMRTELRVARTTAVVVGAFVICWFPFTTIYVLQAYEMCPMSTECVPQWVFLISFWLGYSNSAVNPLLYAAFSRDFRAAFRKVLLRKQSSLKSF